MHQHPRPPQATASPAKSPKTDPKRTNNPREKEPVSSTGVEKDTHSEGSSGIGDGSETLLRAHSNPGQGKDVSAKLSQVIQNFYVKAALTIISTRSVLPPAYNKGSLAKRSNKWFNLELDETDVLRDDVFLWRNCDTTSSRPPTMIIETYLDIDDLTNNQSLVSIGDDGKRWDVEEVLNACNFTSEEGKARATKPTVVLERWHVELGDAQDEVNPKDLSAILPRIYKNSIVLFRSLHAYAKILPAWKFVKKIVKTRSSHSLPKLRYRIFEESQHAQAIGPDTLYVPFSERRVRTVDRFSFHAIDTPAGPFSVHVTYRQNCDFRIDDSESLLSSHFMGIDDHYFTPSLGGNDLKFGIARPIHGAEPGSLPPRKREAAGLIDQSQAYGSLSTFHQTGPPAGSSPLSALRAARDLSNQSPTNSPPQAIASNRQSLQGSKSSLRSVEGNAGGGRRPSVSFQPFKTPTLSASPSQANQSTTSSPRGSLGRTSTLAEARKRSSLGAPPQVLPREPTNTQSSAIASSASTSPRPAPSRYSSSFAGRRARVSSGGGSRTEDDTSSGKTSLNSSAQPGSGILAEGVNNSSGSVKTDDDSIADFLKELDLRKEVKSIHHPSETVAADAPSHRTSAALSNFRRYRESNAALSDSMTTSLHMQRSSSSSSRQLSSVPPMVAGTSMSTSSSPGKPVSPHTPHTPAIPSRLSANSIIEYPQGNHDPSRTHLPHDEDQGQSRDEIPMIDGLRDPASVAINIPTSPRPYHPSYRRSSSVAQQQRVLPFEDDLGDLFPFGMRSASLGADERPPVSLSALIGPQGDLETALATTDDPRHPEPAFSHTAAPDEPISSLIRQASSSTDREGLGNFNVRGTSQRSRSGRGTGRGISSHAEDDEPFFFDMTDLGANQQSRRTVEEGGDSSVPVSSQDRRGEDSRSSLRRGGRRGGVGGTW